MIGGRNTKDGVAIFGKNDPTKTENFKPDFELNYEEKLNYPYIFAIYFNRENKTFNIRAYSGKGSDNRILFIKLTNFSTLVISLGIFTLQINSSSFLK